MKRITVEVQEDHLRRLSTTGRPIMAIAELIWNALDADAMRVTVDVRQSLLSANEQITVSDDGHGIPEPEAEESFGKLGGSWKRLRDRTKTLGRLLHGREGKGRFRAFGLGEEVTWHTRYRNGGEVREITIRGVAPELEYFEVSESQPAGEGAEPGTAVLISGIYESVPNLTDPSYADELSEVFAIYLSQYPHIQVQYCGQTLDPDALKKSAKTYRLPPITAEDGEEVAAELTVIEWNGERLPTSAIS